VQPTCNGKKGGSGGLAQEEMAMKAQPNGGDYVVSNSSPVSQSFDDVQVINYGWGDETPSAFRIFSFTKAFGPNLDSMRARLRSLFTAALYAMLYVISTSMSAVFNREDLMVAE
jgi:hypothetical protein